MPNKKNAKEFKQEALARLLKRSRALPWAHKGFVFDSLSQYILYGLMKAPGHYHKFDASEELPIDAMQAFRDFLVDNGEDVDEIKNSYDKQWADMCISHEDEIRKLNDAMLSV